MNRYVDRWIDTFHLPDEGAGLGVPELDDAAAAAGDNQVLT